MLSQGTSVYCINGVAGSLSDTWPDVELLTDPIDIVDIMLDKCVNRNFCCKKISFTLRMKR